MSEQNDKRIFDVVTRLLAELRELNSENEDVATELENADDCLVHLRLAASEGLEETFKRTMHGILQEEQFGVNETQLAEMAAERLDLQEALDEPQHPIWDWAVDVMDESDDDDQDEDEEEDEDR